MVTLRSWPRPLLHVLAAVFAVMTTLYSGIWIYSARQEPTAYLGIEYSYSEETASLRVVKVLKESPAERAGLVPEDRIVTLDGSPVEAVGPLYRAVGRGRAGDRVRLAVERPGTPRLLFLDVTLDPGLTRSEVPTQTRWLANEILGLYPVLFLAVALAVLFLRSEDRNAWLLALFFGSLI